LNLSIVVLAAGQGTRMRSDLPKVLHRLAGRPMIGYVIDAARALDPRRLVAVVGYGAEQVRAALGDEVSTVVQAEQLGTGHAVWQARDSVAGQAKTVLVLYGDTPLIQPATLRAMIDQHLAKEAAVTLLTFRPDNPAGYGRVVREAMGGMAGRVVAVVEERDATPEQRAIGEVNSGILCFRDEWLWPNLARLSAAGQAGSEVYLTDLVAMARQQGQPVAGVPVPGALEVIGLDNRLKLAQAEGEVRRRINEQWMMAGVTLVDPSVTYIDAGVEIGPDTVIWPNTLLQGRTRIGRGCTLGPGAVVRDSILADGCRVELSVLEGATMDEGSEVGPFGHLRNGAHLGPRVHMGNFGEVKNSYLGPGAKMGHFSYLGDATVGAGANIGAGTITCNYDGQNKHPTTIGQGAFIGSDTMLVAPVTVGDGAKTGAGSVVTHDVPAGSVAYGVPARIRGDVAPDKPDAESSETSPDAKGPLQTS
jgi:bifunctional UDP-N-acetylglucosamine pyrophosphorylase/glucosamine-1-phosphate N-acetyltransferase